MSKELEKLRNEQKKLKKIIDDFEKLSKDPFSDKGLFFKSELKRIKRLKGAEKELRKQIKAKENLHNKPSESERKGSSNLRKQTQQSPIKTPVIIASVMLFIAILPLPYGYYTLLRLVVCGTAIYLAWFAKTINRQGWMWVIGFIALLFNPLIPIHLDKATWSLIDLTVAIIFFTGLFKLKVLEKDK